MLYNQIKERIKDAMRARNTLERDILRVAVGDIETQQARESETMSDEQVQKIIRKIIKSNGETLAVNKDEATREKLEAENVILETLLPKTMSEDEVLTALESVAEAIRGAGNDGQATGIAMKHLKSGGAVVEGGTVSGVVRKLRSA